MSSSSPPTRPGRCTSATPARRPTATRSRGSSRFRGYEVTREYYINDYGSQVIKLGESVRALAIGEPVPADGYHGDYVADLVAPERARELDLETLACEACQACLTLIRASLERFGVQLRRLVLGALAARERSGRARARRCWPPAGRPTPRTARCGCARAAHGDDKDRVLVRSSGEHTYFTSDIAYLEDKRERGYDRLDLRLGRRPPRLHRADEGGLRGARRRPGHARARDPAVRAPARRRGPHRDVQARGRVRHARRAGRRGRRRRGALLPAGALARHDRRPRPRPRRPRERREPRLLRAVRARADRLDPRRAGAERVAAALASLAPVEALQPPSGRCCAGCCPSPASWPTPSSAARPIASPPTRWSSRRSSPPSIATATCSACSRGRPSRCGSRSRWRRGARSRARSTCSASARPSRCDQRGSKRASSASSRALSAALSPSAPLLAPARLVGGRRAAVAPPARQQQRDDRERREHGGDRHQVEGDVEALVGRQREHAGPYCATSRLLICAAVSPASTSCWI